MSVGFDVLRCHKNRSQLQKKSPSCFTGAQNTHGCANELFRGHAGHTRGGTHGRAPRGESTCAALQGHVFVCARARAEPSAASIWNTLERVLAEREKCTSSVFEVAGVSWVSSVSFIRRFLHGARHVCVRVCVCHQATVPSAVQRKHHQAAP